jgi:high-affinity iron transporter
MIAVALLVFREVLEASLIISIVCAATRGVMRRGVYVLGGIGLGLSGAVLVAIGADFIASLAGGAGQDVFNACILLAAVLMIGWHVVWMSTHGAELARDARELGNAVTAGARSLTVLMTVVALAVLRESTEIVLFLYGMAVGGVAAGSLAAGVVAGVIGGASLGATLYLGLLRIPLKHFFGVTNGLLMLLAAGLAAAAAGLLVQDDLLPSWGSQVWDTSALLSDGSLIGKTLGVLVGYRAAPSGIQIAFYVTTLGLLVAAVRWQHHRANLAAALRGARGRVEAVTIIVCAAILASARPARADDFIVYSPYVTASHNEIELRGYQYYDARAGLGGSASELSIAHGVNDWWKPEIYVAEYQSGSGTNRHFQGYEVENTFQLTAPGKYPVDVGVLAAYDRNIAVGTPDAIEFGPLLETTAERFTHVVNLLWEKELGAGARRDYKFRYSYSGTYSISPALRPGFEAYGRPVDHAYQAGPILAGERHSSRLSGNWEYRVGVLLGINREAPRQTWLARLEYEFF